MTSPKSRKAYSPALNSCRIARRQRRPIAASRLMGHPHASVPAPSRAQCSPNAAVLCHFVTCKLLIFRRLTRWGRFRQIVPSFAGWRAGLYDEPLAENSFAGHTFARHPFARPPRAKTALDTMLRGIRTASTNWLGRTVMAVVMGLLAASFAIWGINDIFRGFGRSTLAKSCGLARQN